MSPSNNQEQPMDAESMRRSNRRAAWFWGGLVVCFLTAQVAVGVVAIVLATGDPSVAIEPDYYEKALNWDKHVAEKEASDRLGWSCAIEVVPTQEASPTHQLLIHMNDRSGQSVEDLKGKVKLYHHARAAEIQSLAIKPLSPGLYVVAAQMERTGLWQIELDLEGNAGERFLFEHTLDLQHEKS